MSKVDWARWEGTWANGQWSQTSALSARKLASRQHQRLTSDARQYQYGPSRQKKRVVCERATRDVLVLSPESQPQ